MNRPPMDNTVREGWQVSDHLNQLNSDAKGFVNTKIELAKLGLAEQSGKLSARILLYVVGGIIGTFVLLFASFALANWFAGRLDSVALGYLLVAGLYTVLLIVFILIWKHRLKDHIALMTINEFYPDKADTHEETIRDAK